MNKELEDFKKEIIGDIECLMDLADSIESALIAKSLLERIKPKPEFIEGEIVMALFNGKPVLCEFNNDLDNSTYPYPTSGDNIKNCVKPDYLPMNMTVYDGTNAPDDDAIISVRFKDGMCSGGLAGEFQWTYVEKFQILKDLNP